MRFGLIGKPIKHSLSPAIHSRLHDVPYSLFETLDLMRTLNHADLSMLNVTMPLKHEAFNSAKKKGPWALKTHAVNTLVKTKQGWEGFNTDASALHELFSEWFNDKKASPMHILGRGSTAQTIVAVLKELRLTDIHIYARTPRPNEKTWKDLSRASGILINATPLGLKESPQDYPFDLSVVQRFDAVFDVLYYPYRTPLLQAAIQSKIPTYSGLRMLIKQAIHAVKKTEWQNAFNATECDLFHSVLHESLNIVIIGMPQAGKTTWGKALAKYLNRPFYDLDDIITQSTQKSPQAWIETLGEEAFRKTENQILKTLHSVRGAVIATGGGTVMHSDNVWRLKANGVLVYLQAPSPESFDASRPLSATHNAYQSLLKTRTPVYERVCDYKLDRHIDRQKMVDTWEEKHEAFLRNQWT